MSKVQAQPNALPPQLLTVDEVAEITGMSIPYWRREVLLKRIPVIRFGRAVRINPADLAAYTAQRRTAKRP